MRGLLSLLQQVQKFLETERLHQELVLDDHHPFPVHIFRRVQDLFQFLSHIQTQVVKCASVQFVVANLCSPQQRTYPILQFCDVFEVLLGQVESHAHCVAQALEVFV